MTSGAADILAAETRARHWCDAWNARDLDGVMAHYADEVEVCSPLVAKRLGRADGRLSGKAALRAYFATGMSNPDLAFTFEGVRLGVNAAVVLYKRENGMRVADTIELNDEGEIIRMTACYAGGAPRV